MPDSGRLPGLLKTSQPSRRPGDADDDVDIPLGGDPFGRDLGYLASLVADRKLDPQLGGELLWEEITEAIDRLRNRNVAGKIALTLGG